MFFGPRHASEKDGSQPLTLVSLDPLRGCREHHHSLPLDRVVDLASGRPDDHALVDTHTK
jgi:hypothetical protein